MLTHTPVGPRLFIEQSGLFNLREQIWWNKVVKVIQICFSRSMLSMDDLLLHLVGRGVLSFFGVPIEDCDPPPPPPPNPNQD